MLNSVAFLSGLWKSHRKAIKIPFSQVRIAFGVPGSIPFFHSDGTFRCFKLLSQFQAHSVMCAKLLFHTGDWNCQTIEKQ